MKGCLAQDGRKSGAKSILGESESYSDFSIKTPLTINENQWARIVFKVYDETEEDEDTELEFSTYLQYSNGAKSEIKKFVFIDNYQRGYIEIDLKNVRNDTCSVSTIQRVQLKFVSAGH